MSLAGDNLNSREAILSKVSRKIKNRGKSVVETVNSRITDRQPNVVPARGGAGRDAASHATFIEEAKRAGAIIERAANKAEIPAIIAQVLQNQNVPGSLRLGNDPFMADIPWDKAPLLVTNTGPAEPDDPVGVNVAIAGIAETGTILLASSADSPSMINMLPLINIALLPESRLMGNYEQSLELIRENMPRMASFVTGPSRTADIELELLMGAHGPQELVIILVEGI